MIGRVHPPAGSYFDDPATHIDLATSDDALANALTKLEVIRFYEWINRGDARQRALRSDLVSLCICPQLLPCKYPSAAWCAREHGVSREYASRLQRNFVRQFGGYIQLRGQRSPPGRKVDIDSSAAITHGTYRRRPSRSLLKKGARLGDIGFKRSAGGLNDPSCRLDIEVNLLDW